jgi:CheY-like chemotaxis protein
MANTGRILFADDDDGFRFASAELLRRTGYTVVEARDSVEASALLEKTAFDLIISDIHMPGNTTLQFARDLEELAPQVPVILVTGNPSVQTAAQSVRLHVVAYLVKPLDYDELRQLVAEAIQRRGVWHALSDDRKDLETWIEDLAGFQQLLEKSPLLPPNLVWQHYLEISAFHTLGLLTRLDALTRHQGNVEDGSLAAPDAVEMLNALKETIQVLQRTQRAFKTHELGSLRERLERLIQPSNPDVQSMGLTGSPSSTRKPF